MIYYRHKRKGDIKMKVKYTRVETFIFDTKSLEDYYEMEPGDDENLSLCCKMCDEITTTEFFCDIQADYNREYKLEKI
jgi:hypothetical protein